MRTVTFPIFGVVSSAPTALIILGLFVWLVKRLVQQVLNAIGTAT